MRAPFLFFLLSTRSRKIGNQDTLFFALLFFDFPEDTQRRGKIGGAIQGGRCACDAEGKKMWRCTRVRRKKWQKNTM
jgi:hypothetical protein